MAITLKHGEIGRAREQAQADGIGPPEKTMAISLVRFIYNGCIIIVW